MNARVAIIRDLRNHYTSILSWLKAGAEVFITRKGLTFARLVAKKTLLNPKKSTG